MLVFLFLLVFGFPILISLIYETASGMFSALGIIFDVAIVAIEVLLIFVVVVQIISYFDLKRATKGLPTDCQALMFIFNSTFPSSFGRDHAMELMDKTAKKFGYADRSALQEDLKSAYPKMLAIQDEAFEGYACTDENVRLYYYAKTTAEWQPARPTYPMAKLRKMKVQGVAWIRPLMRDRQDELIKHMRWVVGA